MFLTSVPAAPMQIALGLFVFAVTCLLWIGFALKTMPGNAASTAAGLAAGVANGAFGIGGPPVILFYFASPAGNIVGRATLVTYFLLTDAIAWYSFLAEPVTADVLLRTLSFLPALLAGVWLGARSFKNADPVVFRKWVLALLGLLAVITAFNGIHALSGGQ
jgi:uncharacterized membrane protein YfcA